MAPSGEIEAAHTTSTTKDIVSEIKRQKRAAAVILAAIVIAAAAGLFFYLNRAVALSDSVLYPLAYLGLGCAAVLSGDLAKARKGYQDLFALWKHADTDIPSCGFRKVRAARF